VTPRVRRLSLALTAILGLAAALRFIGLSWGLRHPPQSDESVFVASVAQMIRLHDLDQRFYEYPGLFFLLLRVPLSLLPPEALGSSAAYLAARATVAAFGVLSVFLVWLLARRLVSPESGLVAALILAVAPVEVGTAHMVRPDVVLEALALLFLLVLCGSTREPLRDMLAGLALGAATALKVTGVLLLPSLALDRTLRPGRRLRGILLAGSCAALVFVVATPCLLTEPERLSQGFGVQVAYHYAPSGTNAHSDSTLGFYLGTLAQGLGPVGCALALLGLWKARAAWRPWAPVILFPVCLVSVLSSADARWTRLVLPCLGAVATVAALGFESLAGRWPRGAWALVLAGALVPLRVSAAFVGELARPSTRDRALDWIQVHVPADGSVLTNDSLGLDSGRFQVFKARHRVDDFLLARTVDAVVWRADAASVLPDLQPAFSIPSLAKATGPPLVIYLPRAAGASQVPLEPTMLSASSGAPDLPKSVDGSLDTGWRGAGGPGRVEWVEIALNHPVRVGELDLLLGHRPGRAGRRLQVETSEDGVTWQSVAAAIYTPSTPEGEDSDGPSCQRLVFTPRVTRRLRVVGEAAPRHRWGFAELRLYEIPGG
jgi:4-amino-4-deoxy-L-arabinose transferase-like glycosyltransferase